MSSALQTLNEQNKMTEWSRRIAECRNSGLSVKEWCSNHNLCTQTYYRWQKRLFDLSRVQQEVQFGEVTPLQGVRASNVAVTVRIAGTEVDICNGADASTVETVIRILRTC